MLRKHFADTNNLQSLVSEINLTRDPALIAKASKSLARLIQAYWKPRHRLWK